ncbi:hypothetical protein CONLIGDRAFT_587357 [Coniochaeta ligniaria NRRL 30616]|uniref:DUF3533 domain-containing protein n=1 Tax=Coniochaeta ligniaria NRRL 30616 TaxID=1408157 RepID=A0A1J7IMW6_9PEZI|nr:hypothetical protein CONLIGDRAFT_587357 [Coniochaeta ligniaria NRRL 30616]
MTKLYPRATENRLWRSDAAFKKSRNGFLKASGKNFLYLQVLFLGLFCWIMGSLYQQETHTKNLRIAFVDYENQNGAIGAAVRNAYGRLQNVRFPTLEEVPSADYPIPAELKEAVCRIRYWGALYVWPGASARLEQALAGNLSAADYDPSHVLTYIWNEARYSQIVDAAVSGSLQTLSQNARVDYSAANGTGHVTALTTPDAISVFANPWTLNNVNLQPTTQGSRAIYNTLVIILLMIQEFFYLGIINALYLNFKIYNRANPWRIIAIRSANSLLYTFIGSLCATGAIWAFKSTWEVDYSQWALTWMALWLFAHLNFLALDVFTIWLPLPFVPMALITWIIWNVSSILLPFELSPGFFKIGYAFPAHEVYQVLTDIWSRGCNPQLRVALPVMVVWEVVAFCLSALGVFRRCHYATLAQEEQEALEEQVEADGEEPGKVEKTPTRRTEAEDVEAGSSAEGDTESELSEAMSRADERMRRQESKASRVGYGPAFGLPFVGDEDTSSNEEQR